MMKMVKRLFRREETSPAGVGTSKHITPEYVESLIDAVGRQRVFDRAKELGWTEDTPPLWVWYQICLELISITPEYRQASQPLH
jgi:hypothetical protein